MLAYYGWLASLYILYLHTIDAIFQTLTSSFLQFIIVFELPKFAICARDIFL
jgi:hypothetical protein